LVGQEDAGERPATEFPHQLKSEEMVTGLEAGGLDVAPGRENADGNNFARIPSGSP
jgi:hypothetical protein